MSRSQPLSPKKTHRVGYIFAQLKIERLVVVLRVRSLLYSSVLLGKPQRTRFECSVIQIHNEDETSEIKSRPNQKLFVEECGDDDLFILNFELIARLPSNIQTFR